jgi:hypothetical protein
MPVMKKLLSLLAGVVVIILLSFLPFVVPLLLAALAGVGLSLLLWRTWARG